MNSLAARLNLGLTLSLALLIAAAWWLGHEALHRSTELYVLSRLQHDTEALLGKLRHRADGKPQLTGDGSMPIYGQPFSGHYFKIITDDGDSLRSRSLWDRDLDLNLIPHGATNEWKIHGPMGQSLLVRGAGYQVDGEFVTVAVAEDLTPLLFALRGFERLFAVLAVVGLGSMILIQRLIVRQTFRRLRPVYRNIDDLERGSKRCLTEAVPDEILPLVRKLNGLLAVYDKRLARSRNAAGNLAHAIKGPLNLILQQLERPGRQLADDTRSVCIQQVERLRALVERELKRARIAGGGAPGSVFDPASELPVLRDLLLRTYLGKDLTVNCAVDLQTPLAADREDMLELFGTLLDNACKWAIHRVDCRLEPTKTGIRASVDDDGPGCDEDELGPIRERGARLDERIAGHGLGLSIAAEIVALYGGELTLGRSERLGGFSARVELPLGAFPLPQRGGPARIHAPNPNVS
ncbi:MAG: HAMP domain-containing sensor histidine kinase [Thiohalocapsa sp.]